jgi:diguanylate cyclase (GGDEF)-like protein
MSFSRARIDARIAFWLALVASLCLTPFIAYHLVFGHWSLLLISASAWLVLLGITIETWRTGQVAVRGMLAFAVVGGCAILLATHHLGVTGALWAYPAVVFAYYTLSTRSASSIMLVLCPGVVLVAATQTEGALLARIAATIMLTWLLSLAFSANVERQRREMAELACSDPLTGARNRREMEAELRRAVHLKERYGKSASVILLDLDHFKHINDSHGHQAGDRVLVALTEQVTERLRQSDQLFRVGGEEFLILLPETELAQSRQLGLELGERIRSSTLGGIGGITASLGIAELHVAESFDDWFKRADEALYRAKAKGRDRLELAA